MNDTKLQERLRSGQTQERERRKSRRDRAMQVPVVTQNMPDDAFGQGPIIATYGDTAPTQRELEQDVTMTNPSVESMEGRG